MLIANQILEAFPGSASRRSFHEYLSRCRSGQQQRLIRESPPLRGVEGDKHTCVI
jgi:hypothetical protein